MQRRQDREEVQERAGYHIGRHCRRGNGHAPFVFVCAVAGFCELFPAGMERLGGDDGFCRGDFHVVEIARRPRPKLVGNAADYRAALARHERRVPPYKTSDVHGPPALGNRAGTFAVELARRLGISGAFHSFVPDADSKGRADDARTLRRAIPFIHEPDRQADSTHLEIRTMPGMSKLKYSN